MFSKSLNLFMAPLWHTPTDKARESEPGERFHAKIPQYG